MNNSNVEQPWLTFEKQVGYLFGKFGYEVDHDTKVQGAQTDIIAKSPRRNRPNLIVECKYHEKPKAKVGIDHVENFTSRVMKLRLEGEIDHGYLVTNTGFTADAKASLNNAIGKYVFLVTYNELFAILVNADFYLKTTVNKYKNSKIHSHYVELRTVDTTVANGTIFDAEIGPWNLDTPSTSQENQRYWILSYEEINKLGSYGCTVEKIHNIYELNWEVFRRWLDKGNDEKKKIKASSEVSYKKLQEAIQKVKLEYANDIAQRLGVSEHPEIIELLIQDPPNFPDDLEEFFDLKPPLNIRTIWERYYKQAYNDTVSQQSPVQNKTISISRTENTNAIALENDSEPLHLLPMESAIKSIEKFLADDHTTLYVLLGDYGAGKTTIMERLMYELAQKKLNCKTDPLIRIPLLLNLREYNKVMDFSQLIRTFLTDEADMGDLSLPMFRELNSNGNFVLLLDGFDEMLERVTKPDRRRCFLEIAQYMDFKTKVILTGRPGYFPDHKELADVLKSMHTDLKLSSYSTSKTIEYTLNCLQLMDGNELETFIKLYSNGNSDEARNLIESNPSLYDLARRPVLTAMIMESAAELARTGKREITVRDLYQIYTDKWVQREEDKGKFRVLIDPEKKSTFVRYLAMEMHLTGKLSISFKELGIHIQKYFKIEDIEIVDHFSHDIRTCSFLNRSDDGEYRS
jgi:DNA replication protein DnaC